MKYLPTAALTLILGGACGYFQYWMAVVLEKKRWLLLLQPGLFMAAAGCFLAWIMGLEGLEDSPARLAWAPFAALLVCTLVGWIMGAVRRRRR